MDRRATVRSARSTLASLALLAALAAVASPARAQERPAGDSPASPEEAVTALFDAMRAADSARARALFHPEATLSRPVEGDSGVALQRVPLEAFLAAVGGAEPGQLDERIGPVRVQRDGRLATAWMAYTFLLDGSVHHCGVNAFQLFRGDRGWEIFGIADTSRTEGCREEPGSG